MMKPDTLAKAFEIASLQESTIVAINKFQKPKSFVPIHSRWNPYPAKPPDETRTKEPWPKASKTAYNHKTITPTDFQTKRNLGICNKCDEKYTTGHVCKNRSINFILVDKKEDDGK